MVIGHAPYHGQKNWLEWTTPIKISQKEAGNNVQLRTLLLSILMLTGGARSAEAQSPEALLDAHRYTEAIAQLRDGASPGAALGEVHLRRGYALRDLARLQAALGTAYYTKRDTSAVARSGSTTAYYAARHRVVTSATGGEDVLRRLVQSGALPAVLQARAHVWIGWAQYRDGDEAAAQERWSRASGTSTPAVAADLALAHWRAGKPLPTLDCGADGSGIAALRCRLWAAIRAEDWGRAAALQEDLIQLERPAERTKTFRTRNGSRYDVRFYDPGTLWALAVADFRAAAAAYERAGQKHLQAGLAALEGREYDVARSALEAAGSTPYRPIYRAVLGEETGTPSSAGALWEKERQNSNAQVRGVWAQEASPYDAYRKAVRSYCKDQDAPDNMRLALRLGRAALNVGLSETAYRLMRDPYPVNQNNELREIDPAYLATFAHVKFRVGPQFEPEILRHINALKTAYTIASIAYDLAQGYYVPERTDGVSR
jgi:tetratricopeptide (TPR) repeat protein